MDKHTIENRDSYTAVVTVLGQDKPGIIAAVTNILAKHNVNIRDISQTIVQDVFNMIMLVDTTQADIAFDALASELEHEGLQIACKIFLQHKDVFASMHRI